MCPFPLLWCRLETELEADAARGVEEKAGGVVGLVDSSCPSHQSQSSQPRKVAKEPQPTTATGETRS